MTKLLISALALASSVLFTSLTADPALADRRVALVIGNAQYKNTSLSLPNPKNDADDVAATLRTLGFEVVLATNADKRALNQAMQQFARQVTDADSALFFYAGHAMQYQGRNYLMPIDAELEDEISLRYQMIAGIFRGEIAAREHKTLLDCALARDAKTACDVLTVHIEACVDYTVANSSLDKFPMRQQRAS